jgi:RND superfamily putative drug exporter
MLGFLGPRVLSRRERAALAADGPTNADGTGVWLRWARIVEAHKSLAALGALAVVVVLALPAFGLRLGSADAGTDPPGWTTHQAYTALARGFGPGFNGPLELAAQVRSAAGATAFNQLLATAARTPGVASVTPVVTSLDGRAVIATVYPASRPQAQQTVDLVNHLRQDLIPAAEQGSGLVVHVGGVTASNIDFAHVLTDKLPVFIAVVVVLAFLLLLVVFRSLLVPLVASIMNLVSVGAALGAVNAVFNWGWGAAALGLSGTGPVEAFLPVIMFSVLFGLSMDYEVFTVSRMQEEWRGLRFNEMGDAAARSGRGPMRNHLAVAIGQAKSSRIIAAAAAIMIVVFGSFLLSDHRILEEFGFGLGFSVLIDALVIRSLLLPALMHLIGPANWALPGWLDRFLPRLSVDPSEKAVPAAGEADAVGIR